MIKPADIDLLYVLNGLLNGRLVKTYISWNLWLSMVAGEIVRTYKGYVNLPTTLYSVGIFVL